MDAVPLFLLLRSRAFALLVLVSIARRLATADLLSVAFPTALLILVPNALIPVSLMELLALPLPMAVPTFPPTTSTIKLALLLVTIIPLILLLLLLSLRNSATELAAAVRFAHPSKSLARALSWRPAMLLAIVRLSAPLTLLASAAGL